MSTDNRRHRLHDHSDDNSGGRIAAQHVTGLSPYATGSTTTTTSGGAAVLDDLGDVDLVTTAPVANDPLVFDGSQWVPNAAFLTKRNGGGDVISAHGSMGATETFDPADGNVHTGTLNANCTFTLTAPTGSGACTLELRLTQDSTGGWTITWPGTVTVLGTLDTTLSTTSIVILETLDGGTTWVAVVVGGSSASALTVKDEGSNLDTAVTSIDFVGAGVTATNVSHAVTVTIPTATVTSISALGFVGPIIISDSPSTPLVFADLLQNDAQDDLMYADL